MQFTGDLRRLLPFLQGVFHHCRFNRTDSIAVGSIDDRACVAVLVEDIRADLSLAIGGVAARYDRTPPHLWSAG